MKKTDEKLNQICGIVMPISSIDGCTSEHWQEVQDIIRDVIDEAGLTSNLVSDSDDVGVIQGRIIQNLYNYPIIICDVSGKNPNVMFELGIRLAFDKATIIIKDDVTDYSFDTSPIEHIAYPRDLRFNKINTFKDKLKTKLLATLEKSVEDKNFSPFLKNFGEFIVPKLEQKEVGFNDFVVTALNSIQNEISNLKRQNNSQSNSIQSNSPRLGLKKPKNLREKEIFIRNYVKRIYNSGKKDIVEIKNTANKYPDSWERLGFTLPEVQSLIDKVDIDFDTLAAELNL